MFWFINGRAKLKEKRKVGDLVLKKSEMIPCEDKIGKLSLEEMGEKFGKAIKFILPTHLWEYSNDAAFDIDISNPPQVLIDHIVNGFLKEDSNSMNVDDPWNDCLKQLVQYSKGLKGDRFKIRRRKNRISMVLSKYVKFLLARGYKKSDLPEFDKFSEKVKKIFLIDLTILMR
jgi:hypothetical protein